MFQEKYKIVDKKKKYKYCKKFLDDESFKKLNDFRLFA